MNIRKTYQIIKIFIVLLFGLNVLAQAGPAELDDISNSALELARRKRDQFVQYADEKTLLSIIGGEFQHANMVITSISDPKTVDMGDSYELTVGFDQIRIPLSAARGNKLVSEDADKLGTRTMREMAGRPG